MAQKTIAFPRRPRIALIGPIAPYRTGIAQYSGLLRQALQAHADVRTVSFSRQYPRFLYPGGGDDCRLRPDGEREGGVRYTLDICNPLSWRRSADEMIREGCDLAVVNWWTLIWQPGMTCIARRLRRGGVKVVYLCHNLVNHRTGGFMGLVDAVMAGPAAWMIRQADAYVVQSSQHRDELLAIKPGAEVLFRPHPVYDRFPQPTGRVEPRGRLELLFFGIVRPYKGLDVLLDALRRLRDGDLYVTVAGEIWGDGAALQRQINDMGIPNLETDFRYIDDAQTAAYFARADVVVAPYRSVTGSGVVSLAYHYDTPVIASDVGGLNDVVVEGRTGHLVPPGDADALARAIARMTRGEAAAMRPAIREFCERNSWDAMARAICGLAGEPDAVR